MKLNQKHVLVCDCEGTMPIDGEALAKACGRGAEAEGDLKVATHLCRRQIEEFQRVAGIAAEADETLLVACTQEAPLFLETGDDMPHAPRMAFTNIREKAGWSDAGKDKTAGTNLTAKMAALLSEAAMDLAGARSVSMKSDGTALVLGRGDDAVQAAKTLARKLNVTLILEGAQDVPPPPVMDIPIFAGKRST